MSETTEQAAAAPPAPPSSFRIDPDGSRVRTLIKPIVGHHGQVREIRLRQPTYREFMSIGDPSAMIIMSGAVLPQEDLGVIGRYIEILAIDVNPLLLEQCDYRDAMALRDMVLDFFKAASASASTSSPTS